MFMPNKSILIYDVLRNNFSIISAVLWVVMKIMLNILKNGDVIYKQEMVDLCILYDRTDTNIF
jgi:hypothetical protein